MPLASGLARKAAARPTSVAVSGAVSGAFADTYSSIFSIMPIALAARDASGPAEIVLTRMPTRRPASYASTRVSLSRAAFAAAIPPRIEQRLLHLGAVRERVHDDVEWLLAVVFHELRGQTVDREISHAGVALVLP